MNYVIQVFGAFIAIASIVLVLRPTVLFDLLRKYQHSPVLYGLAVFVRLILGIALVVVAPMSHFPLALGILGWVIIAAAIFIGAMGRTRFSKLMAWALGLAAGWGRVAGLFGILFGAFLIYAAQ